MENWKLLIENFQEKKLKKFLQDPFLDPEKASDFIKVISQLLAKKDCPRQVRRFLQLKILPSLNRKIITLDAEGFWKLFILLANDERSLALFFDLFAGCDHPEKAIQVSQILLKVIISHMFEFTKSETEATIITKLFVFLCRFLTGGQKYPAWASFLRIALVDQKAQELLFYWFQFFNQMTLEGFFLIPISQLPRFEGFQAGPATSLILREDGNFSIPVPDEYLSDYHKIFSEFINRLTEIQADKLKFLLWFQENREWFKQAWDQMWKEVVSQRHYGIRPGEDIIKIGIEALRSSDWQFSHIQYLSETIEPPGFRVRFWLEFAREVTFFEWLLQPGSMRNPNNTFFPEGDPREVLDAVLVYIALHGYWRIVTQKKNPLATKPPTGVRPKGSPLPRSWTQVRWHFRRIKGQASQEAKERALAIAGVLPFSGKTFVRPHTREIAKIKKEYLFIYQESDIGYPG